MVFPKVVFWFRDHLLSIAVLLMFPVAIAGYYWSNSASEPIQPPQYLLLDEPDEPPLRAIPLSSETTALVSVMPETPMTLEAPPSLRFPANLEAATLSTPQPLTVDTEATGSTSQAEQLPPLPHEVPVVPQAEPIIFSARGVWLTGSIEEVESSPDVWQNASRVHDLVAPRRN